MMALNFHSKTLIALFFLCVVFFMQGISRHGVEYRDDEIFYFESSQEMLQSGELLSPTYFGQDRFQKPILFYWLIIFAFKVLGVNWFAARLVAVIFAGLTVCLTYAIARRFFDTKVAVLSSFILMTTPLFFRHAKNVVPDMALNFFIVLSIYWAMRFADDPARKRNAFLFFVFCSIGFMIKGFAALIVPVLALVAFSLGSGKRELLRKINFPLGLVVFAVIVLPWFVYMIMVHGSAYADYMLVHETKDRLLVGGQGNVILNTLLSFLRNAAFYLKILWNYFAPWSLFALLGIPWAAVKLAKGRSGEPALLWLVGWFFIVLIFFSLVHVTINHYILVLSTPFAILLAHFFVNGCEEKAWVRQLVKSLAVILLFFGFLAWSFVFVFLAGASALWLAVFAALLAGLVGIIVKGREPARAVLLVALFLVFVLSQTSVMFKAGLAGHDTLARFAATINRQLDQDTVVGVGSHDLHEKEFQVYFSSRIEKVANSDTSETRQMLTDLFAHQGRVFCLIIGRDFQSNRDLFQDRNIRIVQKDYIFRKRLYLDRNFLYALLTLDRKVIHDYLMEEVILLEKESHA